MKAQQHRDVDPQRDLFEADLEDGIHALFASCPTLCGFAVRDSENLAGEGLDLRHVSELLVTEVSVYPQPGLEAPAHVCRAIASTLVELLADCPGAFAMLRERTFARTLH